MNVFLFAGRNPTITYAKRYEFKEGNIGSVSKSIFTTTIGSTAAANQVYWHSHCNGYFRIDPRKICALNQRQRSGYWCFYYCGRKTSKTSKWIKKNQELRKKKTKHTTQNQQTMKIKKKHETIKTTSMQQFTIILKNEKEEEEKRKSLI